MATLTFADLAALCGGELVTGGDVTVSRVVIDSREADEESVFFAIRGERLDGHEYVAQALERARGAVVVNVPSVLPADKAFVKVADTTTALQNLARELRRRSGWYVVGITGSAGKTTTKEMIATLVSTERKMWKTWGNFNNHIGLPLCMANTPEDIDVLVAEMGMSAPREIDLLAKIAEPDLGVYTTIQAVHLEFFDSIEGIAAAKRELLENIDPTGAIVVNADDPRVMAISEGFRGRRVSYGVDQPADVMATDIENHGLFGIDFILRAEGESRKIKLMMPGRHNLDNLLAAIAAARVAGISWDGVISGIGQMVPASHRGELVQAKGLTIYDDTYNSNPYALSKALDLLARADCEGRRIAVIGDMLELGPTEMKLHFDAGNSIPSGIDVIVGVGERARSVIEGASDNGFSREHLFHVADADEAADFLEGFAEAGDLILLKASRGIGLDRVVDRLKGKG